MNWDDLRYVLAVARAGTLTGAARRLGVSHTTVSRRLAVATAMVGVRLFVQMNGAWTPTKAGEAVIAQAGKIEQQISLLPSNVAVALKSDSVVRVSAAPVLMHRIILPNAPEFLAGHDHIRLDLLAEPRNLSLARHEVDVAVRFARPEGDLAALTTRIGVVRYAAYALRKRRGTTHPWISYEEGMRHLPNARWIIENARGRLARIAVSDAETAIYAVRAGLGQCVLPTIVGDLDPSLRKLDIEIDLSREVWVLSRREDRKQAQIADVLAWLTRLFLLNSPVAPSRRGLAIPVIRKDR
jgi:DNA-binding transcriptional LysR family regulator